MRNDGRWSHGATAAGREVGGERVTASGGEQIKAGVNDKAKDGRAGTGTVSPKVQEFTELWVIFQKIDTFNIRGEVNLRKSSWQIKH